MLLTKDIFAMKIIKNIPLKNKSPHTCENSHIEDNYLSGIIIVKLRPPKKGLFSTRQFHFFCGYWEEGEGGGLVWVRIFHQIWYKFGEGGGWTNFATQIHHSDMIFLYINHILIHQNNESTMGFIFEGKHSIIIRNHIYLILIPYFVLSSRG